MRHRPWTVVALALVASLLVVSLVLGASGDHSLPAWVASGGGGTLSAGGYSLSGTIGQTEAGQVWSGEPYKVVGGFWHGSAPPPAPPPTEVPPAPGTPAVYLPLTTR